LPSARGELSAAMGTRRRFCRGQKTDSFFDQLIFAGWIIVYIWKFEDGFDS